MGLGTGVFLAGSLLALVWLYSQTKDRWHWRKIMTIGAIVLFVIPVLIAGTLWGYDTAEAAWQNRLRQVNSLADAHLGMSKADVIYHKGEPKHEDDGILSYGDLSIYEWIYLDDNNKVYAIESSKFHINLLGISVNDTEKDLIDRLGKPSSISRSKDNTIRLFNYPEYRVYFTLEKGIVQSVGTSNTPVFYE